jgi:hypothetical protein
VAHARIYSFCPTTPKRSEYAVIGQNLHLNHLKMGHRDFLRLANALSVLYPIGSEEKRLSDAMLLAVPR